MGGIWIMCVATLLLENSYPINAMAHKCSGELETCNSEYTPVPNMVAALVGYNPVLSNMLASTDPGLRQRIFEPTYANPDTYQREVYSFIKHQEEVHFDMSSKSKAVSSYKEYVGARTGAFSFAESSSQTSSYKIPLLTLLVNYEKTTQESQSSQEESSYNNKINFFKETRGEIYMNYAKCHTHKISLSDYETPVFTQGFIRAMKELEKAASNPDSEESRRKLRMFINEFGTHYMSTAWMGATLAVESIFEQQSSSESERKQRESCVGKAYGNSINEGVRLVSFQASAKVPIGGGAEVGVEAQLGGQGFDNGNTNSNSELNCDSYDDLNKNAGSTSFAGTRVVTTGSYPKKDQYEWAENAAKSPKVVKFKLKPISNLFRPSFLEEHSINATLIRDYLDEAWLNYCNAMLGKECPEANGCGFQSHCPLTSECVDDESKAEGFYCREPVDCVWSQWGSWGSVSPSISASVGFSGFSVSASADSESCSITGTQSCGRGTIKKHRTKTGPFYGGKQCSGSSSSSKSCGVSGCPTPKEVSFSGNWGKWGTIDYCGGSPYKGYAKQFKVQVESPIGDGAGEDDTALNSICLICSGGDTICSKKGLWGNWYTASGTCNSGFTGFDLKSEPCCHDDDTAANDVDFMCDGGWMDVKVPTSAGKWNTKHCPSGTVICGLQTRVEGSVGRYEDDTALNGLAVKCCKNIWTT